MNPETRLVRNAIKDLKRHGGWWVKIHGGAFQVSGIPDVIGCYRGRFVALEFKLPETASDLSPRQVVTIERIRTHGGIAEVCTSSQDALEVVLRLDAQLDQ